MQDRKERRAAWAKWAPRFRELAYSFYLRKEGPSAPPPEMSGWQDEFEKRFGDGKFAERLEILNDTVEWCEDSTDADPGIVCAILEAAKAEAGMVALAGQQIDYYRALRKQAAKIRRHLEEGASSALRFRSVDEKPLRDELNGACQTILRLLPDDPLLNAPAGPPDRRSHRGQSERPYLARARAALAEAGVSENDYRTDLLIAAALLPVTPRQRVS